MFLNTSKEKNGLTTCHLLWPIKNIMELKCIKKQYWYKTDIDVCVICGIETKDRSRVYKKEESGTLYNETVCWSHFI